MGKVSAVMHFNKEQLPLKFGQLRMGPGNGLHGTPTSLIAQLGSELRLTIRAGLTKQLELHGGGVRVGVVHASIIRSPRRNLVRLQCREWISH